MSSRTSSTGSSPPAAIRAYLQDPEDKPLIGHQLVGSNPSGPLFARHVPSSRTSTAIPSQSSAPRSMQGSVNGSSAGLTFRSTTYNSGSSVATSYGAGRLPKEPLVDLNHDGFLVRRPAPRDKKYECPFDRLECSLTFDQFKDWFEHSLTHFQIHEPPSKCSCCFCNETFEEKSGMACWKARMEHTKTHHDRGEQLGTSRIDHELYRYLWCKRIINDIQFKEFSEGMKVPATSNVTSGKSRAASEGAGAYLTPNNETRRRKKRDT